MLSLVVGDGLFKLALWRSEMVEGMLLSLVVGDGLFKLALWVSVM